jgi:hypothetical protein
MGVSAACPARELHPRWRGSILTHGWDEAEPCQVGTGSGHVALGVADIYAAGKGLKAAPPASGGAEQTGWRRRQSGANSSPANSLINRENTGNFSEFRRFDTSPWPPRSWQIEAILQIP